MQMPSEEGLKEPSLNPQVPATCFSITCLVTDDGVLGLVVRATNVFLSFKNSFLCLNLSSIVLQEAKCAYIIIIMAVFWCTEVIPLAVTSLMPVVFFPLLGVQSSKSVRNLLRLIQGCEFLCFPTRVQQIRGVFQFGGAAFEHVEQCSGFLYGKMLNSMHICSGF